MAATLIAATLWLLPYRFKGATASEPCITGAGTDACTCQAGYSPYVNPQDEEADRLCYPTCTYCFNENCFLYKDNEIRCTACTNDHVLLERSCWKQFEFGRCNLKHEGDQIVPTCYDCSKGYQKIQNGCYRSLSRGMCFRYNDSYNREREHCVSCKNGWTMAYGDCICAGFGNSDRCLSAGAAVAISVIITVLLCAAATTLVLYFFVKKQKKSSALIKPDSGPLQHEGASLLSTHGSFI